MIKDKTVIDTDYTIQLEEIKRNIDKYFERPYITISQTPIYKKIYLPLVVVHTTMSSRDAHDILDFHFDENWWRWVKEPKYYAIVVKTKGEHDIFLYNGCVTLIMGKYRDGYKINCSEIKQLTKKCEDLDRMINSEVAIWRIKKEDPPWSA